MDKFINPDAFMQLSTSEKFFDSLQVMALGMGVVFIVLIALMFIIKLMGMIFAEKPKKAEGVVAVEPVVIQTATPSDDEEIAAVIAAAIASSMNTSVNNIRIQSIRPTENIPVWQAAGIQKNM